MAIAAAFLVRNAMSQIMVYPIRMAVIVESLLLPVALNLIDPAVVVLSRTDIRRFPAGDVMNPERDMHSFDDEAMSASALAMTVVPSHSFARNAAPEVVPQVTVPETNQVPTVPCATVGPSK